ncbi:MAG: bifunctional folylpolyglutamate synthase/dihydrofolate synthase [Herbinix sp.]|nr:bifunctional folylpolyglutamate synthase/dihydrofolate synthase [Herbinix sp.]
MTYEEAMEYIKNTNKLGSVPGLEAIRNLLERLGNPQDKLKIIHVAGTNGKGSTISFLSAILAAAGYRVGIYISPTVFSYREKLQIVSLGERIDSSNDILSYDLISEEDVCKAIRIIRAVCDEMVSEGQAHPTSFEIETAMAFLYMQWEQVDFLILETGMGGRLDATNIISSPLCSVITSVSLDHMLFLGDTLEQIANEKAGIMKHGSYVLSSNQQPEVLNVFYHKANELDIPMIIADSSKAVNIGYNEEYTSFEYPSDDKPDIYKIRLLGRHQVQNAILAIETARSMARLGYIVPDRAIKRGLWIAKWHGRFEQISKAPDIFIDGAHNEEAALSLQDSIEIYFTNRRLVFMIGVLADKDYPSMLRILAPMADTIITLKPDNSRALPSDKLADVARAYCNKVFDEKNIEHAIKRAYIEAGIEDVIFAFGSLSFLGSLVSSLRVRKDEDND